MMPKMPTLDERIAAVDALMAGNPRPLRSIKWRAFWWGFTHPFDRRLR